MRNLDRRVCKLRVRSQDEASAASDVHALQDAFGIASLSGLPPRGLFLIRKLDLGTYPSHSTAQNISRIIDQRVQTLEYQSLCVDEGDHPQHNMVWFSDVAQVVFCLVKLIAKEGNAEAWYWRTLFPSWRPGMDLAATLIAINEDFPEQQTKPLVFARAFEQLLLHFRLDTILSAVTPDIAHLLLSGSGLFPYLATAHNSKPVRAANRMPDISAHWQALLRRAIVNWGGQDVRSIWIAFSALILHNPAVTQSAALQPMIVRLIENHSVDIECIEKPEITSIRSETSTATSKPEFDDRPPTHSKPRAAIQFIAAESTDAAENGAHQASTESSLITSANQNIFTGFEYIENCGLAFVITLLEWLGMKQLLFLNPEMAAINLPVRLVQAIAQRLGIADRHPVLLAMPELTEVTSAYIEDFTCPSDWQELINTTKQNKNLHRYQVTNSTCYITDRTEKLLLYVGDSDLPDWMASYAIVDHADKNEYPNIDDLQITIQLLASRYLHRYAKISIRNLVNKRGQIASSNTHLDILLDSQQIDIRIRIAGLDIDPGWVPWCARVVQFHYGEGGTGDA